MTTRNRIGYNDTDRRILPFRKPKLITHLTYKRVFFISIDAIYAGYIYTVAIIIYKAVLIQYTAIMIVK